MINGVGTSPRTVALAGWTPGVDPVVALRRRPLQ
jgi:hypothetical protein